ncbi:unannotated protein [freshwater metagenome]|uniref:Unannotated protein n=1 Tax=freshwater metagenome TaxID=449393 RepID=A0A6J7QEP6_9ZZZZ
MAEQREGGARSDGCGDVVSGDAALRIGVDPADAQGALLGDALDDIAIGGKVVGVDDDFGTPRSRSDGCAGELVEHDGGGVGDDDLPGRCSECCRPDGIADRVRPLHPFVGPPPNEPLRPLPIDERFETLRGDLQGTAEGIAVEVGEDIAVAGVDEAVEIALEGIRGVEVVGSLEKGHGVTVFLEGALRGSRRGLAGRQ